MAPIAPTLGCSSSSSSPNQSQKNKQDLFLNFRGIDVRGFVRHLHYMLRNKNVATVTEREKFERGMKIENILKESRISIMIILENYATLQEHITSRVTTWRAALKHAGSLSGLIAGKSRPEVDAIGKLVEQVLDMLPDSCFCARPRSYDYHVFLDFRGADVRHGFAYNLKEALREKEIKTFFDNESLTKGEKLVAILKKIELSKMSIMIFSKDYASSRYCLEELVKILECKETWGHKTLPIFYNVDPDVVAKQSGSYEEAFRIHGKEKGTTTDELLTWRSSLVQAAALSGFVLENNRPEKVVIGEIVEEVKKLLEDFDSEKTLEDDVEELPNNLKSKKRFLTKRRRKKGLDAKKIPENDNETPPECKQT